MISCGEVIPYLLLIPLLFVLTVVSLAGESPRTPVINPSSTTSFLALPEGRIAYDDTGGTGPLVIAVPSMGDLRGEYRYLTPLLAQAGYRVVTLDVRGQGESSVGWSDYSAHAVGRDVLALTDHLGAGPAVVIGTSFAGGSALWAAHDAPDKIRGVIMIGPVLKDYPTPFYVRAAVSIGFAGPWRVSFWIRYWDSLFPLRKPADHEAYRAALAANLHEAGRMAVLKNMVALSKADTESILDQIGKPGLIIMGSRDKDFSQPREEAQALASRTRAQLLVAEGAGHYPQVEAPEAITPRILTFIRELH